MRRFRRHCAASYYGMRAFSRQFRQRNSRQLCAIYADNRRAISGIWYISAFASSFNASSGVMHRRGMAMSGRGAWAILI